MSMYWYLEVLKKYAVFDGRAHRKEYWMFVLFNIIITLALFFIEGLFFGMGIIGSIYTIAVFLPDITFFLIFLHIVYGFMHVV